MEEEKPKEGEGEGKEEETKEEETEGEPSSPAPVSKVSEAKELLSKIEKANKEAKAWVERAEELKAEAVVSGESEAGKPAAKKKEETPEEYSKRVMANEL